VWHAHVFGQKADSQKKTHARAKTTPPDLTQVKEALSHIPADNYDIWLRVGMALHAAGDEHFSIWEAWSATCSEKFKMGECHRKWESFNADRENGATIATLFDLAIKNGYGTNSNGSGAARWPGDD